MWQPPRLIVFWLHGLFPPSPASSRTLPPRLLPLPSVLLPRHPCLCYVFGTGACSRSENRSFAGYSNELVFFVCFVSGFICINLVAQAVLPGRSGVSTSCHAQGLSQRALVFAQAVPHKVRSESKANTAGIHQNNETLPRMSPDCTVHFHSKAFLLELRIRWSTLAFVFLLLAAHTQQWSCQTNRGKLYASVRRISSNA